MITDSIGCDEMATSEMRAQDFHPSCFREDAQNFVMFVVNIEKKTKKCSDESGRAVSSLNKFAAFGKSKLFFSPSFVLKLVLLVQGNRKKKGKKKEIICPMEYENWGKSLHRVFKRAYTCLPHSRKQEQRIYLDKLRNKSINCSIYAHIRKTQNHMLVRPKPYRAKKPALIKSS